MEKLILLILSNLKKKLLGLMNFEIIKNLKEDEIIFGLDIHLKNHEILPMLKIYSKYLIS